MDKVIGKGRSLVRVTVVDWDDRGDVIRLKRLSLALVVDQTKIVVDEEGAKYTLSRGHKKNWQPSRSLQWAPPASAGSGETGWCPTREL